ncbi:MAG: P-loop NTPase fold protein [Bacteroidetes bacterium]|nr:P-loop NTPase fold protein [Bacteroidota bacterium]
MKLFGFLRKSKFHSNPKQSRPTTGDFSADYSSRIKKIVIQLHDYQYYHGPFKEFHGDSRFIGRKKILEKLKSLLTNSEFTSGVYLLTGYRGSGKTSLVNKVISEIDNHAGLLKGNKIAYFFVLLFYLLVSFFYIRYIGISGSTNPSTNITGLWILLLSCFTFSAVIILYHYWNIFSDKRIQWLKPFRRKAFFFGIWCIRDLGYHEKKYLTSYIPWFSLTLIPLMITSYIFILWCKVIDSIFFLKNLCLFFYIIVFLNMSYSAWLYIQDKPKGFFFRIRTLLYGLFQFNTYIFIKLNLGHSKLREIDILRLLARNVKTEYARYYKRHTFSQILISLAIFYFIYILSYLIYYKPEIYNAHNDLKQNCKVYEYFPSQIPSLLRHDSVQISPEQIYTHISNHFKAAQTQPEPMPIVNFQHKTVVEYIWEKSAFVVSYAVILGDSYLYIIYDYSRTILIKGFLLGIPDYIDGIINKSKFFIVPFSLIPYHLDYFFIIYVCFLYLIIKKLLINGIFLAKRPKKILKKIAELNEIIVSEVTVDKLAHSAERSSFNFFTFFSPSTKKRTVADVREIEKNLIEIFDDIDQIRFPYSRPNIIVIFDELDKIETHTSIFEGSTDEKRDFEAIPNQFIKNPNPSFTIDGTRERQQTLQVLLSNLKYFLSDAKAKFIFIAGREMYDASLADISDRNYFMGSIFHDVINVNSFLSDDSDKTPSDITSMIEKYVCQFIIHPQYIEYYSRHHRNREYTARHAGGATVTERHELLEYYTLEVFNDYLIQSFPDLLDEKQENKSVADCILARQKREKIINIVRRFIVYLTHASNGAPKKVTNYFEKFIEFQKVDVLLSKEKSIERNILLVTLKKEKRIKERVHPYLMFNYSRQYELGLINYITLPIILSISNHIKNFGDKLLVSATFLSDHLLKFHKDGFSWRNIEYIPEILEINRTPELRTFISNILNFLLQTHLQTILSGLYTFRFNQRLSNEISFLSKVSEEASASFNFTLDESLAIKHYYHSLLFRLEERYKKITNERTGYIHSIAMVHTILGDLYFYDEEYNDAIIEYMDSVQYLRYSGFSDENFSLLLILVRSMLKLGLSFEKRKTYSSAYEIYKELCYFLIKHRDIDVKELGLEEKGENREIILTTPQTQDYPDIEKLKNEILAEKINKDANSLHRRFEETFPLENNFSPGKQDIKFAAKEGFINRITEQLNPPIEKILGKISSFEGLRLIYQPLLARLQIMEKCIMGGITKVDLFRVEKEFDYLQKAINQRDKFLIKIEFYNKIGDILFFKRGNIRFKEEKQECNCNCWKGESEGRFKSDLLKDSLENKEYQEDENKKQKQENDTDFIFYLKPDDCAGICGPDLKCASCYFYAKSLELFIRNYLYETKDDSKPKTLDQTFKRILTGYERFSTSGHTFVRVLAELISDLADSQMGCLNLSYKDFNMEEFLEFVENPKNLDLDPAMIIKFSIPGILYKFYLSALFYKKANDYRGYVWQLTKILYLLKETLYKVIMKEARPGFRFDDEKAKKFIEDCDKKFVRKAIRGCWAAYESAHMNEVPKHKNVITNRGNFNNKAKPYDFDSPSGPVSLNRISVNNDIEEITILFSQITSLVHEMTTGSIQYTFENSKIKLTGIVVEHYLKNIVSPYSDTDTVYNRIIRLNYKVKLNFKVFICLINNLFKVDSKFLDLLNGDLKKNKEDNAFWYKQFLGVILGRQMEGDDSKTEHPGICKELENDIRLGYKIKLVRNNQEIIKECFRDGKVIDIFSHLIADSLYCLNEIIEIANAYGKSYILNHSYVGSAHEKMLFWSVWYIAIDNFLSYSGGLSPKVKPYEKALILKLRKKIINLLKSWMDPDAFHSQSIVYHGEMAIRRYYSAYETHVGGKAYKNFIDRMCFLNDDFNDKVSHFYTAYERFGFNNKGFITKVNKLKQFNEVSKLYNYEDLINTRID